MQKGQGPHYILTDADRAKARATIKDHKSRGIRVRRDLAWDIGDASDWEQVYGVVYLDRGHRVTGSFGGRY